MNRRPPDTAESRTGPEITPAGPLAGTRSPARPRPLGREALTAYLAPALSAGTGGLLTGTPDLTLAAVTSIGLPSALVTLLLGAHLRRLGARRRARSGGGTGLPQPLRAVGYALLAAALTAPVGLAAATLLPTRLDFPGTTWPDRLALDLPLSATLAALIVTFRHRDLRPPASASASAPAPAPASAPAPAPASAPASLPDRTPSTAPFTDPFTAPSTTTSGDPS
ncbi:hypothetical protein [Streptomyces sp. NPDC097619]|uniref:hypothetical protein n=1 Tax=Streptomyces sp. NPDC097619 TaxID=3157228 RepID=UPI0033196126